MKRNSSVDDTICTKCTKNLNADDRAPRRLHCGHWICAACEFSVIATQVATKPILDINCPHENDCGMTRLFNMLYDPESRAAKRAKLLRMHTSLSQLYVKLSLKHPGAHLLMHSADFETSQTIAEVKKAFQLKFPQLPEHVQRVSLTFDGAPLDDTRTLRSYGVTYGQTIWIDEDVDVFDGGALHSIIDPNLNKPNAVAMSRDGKWLVVAEIMGFRLIRLDDVSKSALHAKRTFLDRAELDQGSPDSVCFSADGNNVFVSHRYARCVLVYCTWTGALLRRIGQVSVDEQLLDAPIGMCLSGDGALLYVADCKRIQVFDVSTGTLKRTLGKDQLTFASSVCLSHNDGLLFVCDMQAGCVHVFTVANGALARTIGTEGKGIGQLLYPGSVCLCRDGTCTTLFVSDGGNNRVQVFNAADGVVIPSKLMQEHGHDDGQFHSIAGMCTSPDGKLLYVADRLNHRVQVFTACAPEPLK